MNFSRRVLVASCCTALLLAPVQTASAYTVTPNFDEQICQFDPNQPDSAVAVFWKDLKGQAIAQRLDELDAADPGLKAAIEAYNNGAPDAPEPGELQARISDTGSPEGLGMFTPRRVENQDGIEASTGAKTQYTPSEARAAALAITADPAVMTQNALQTQATKSGLRIDQITADLFASRHAAYNATQEALRDSLNKCADEVENHARELQEQEAAAQRKQRWLWVGAGLGVVVALTLLRVWINRRKPNRHHKTN